MIKAIGKTLILRPLVMEKETMKNGLLFLNEEKPIVYAEVVSRGSEVEATIQEGSKVILSKRAGFTFDHEGVAYMYADQKEIVAVT